MAIAARFDLELIQWDVVNAFVHADLPYDIFMKLPPGYAEENTILKLKKALYGLRESPLLWQKKFMTTLRELGFQPVPHEPCCWIKDGVIIFFYVDDIVIAYRNENEAAAQSVTAALRSQYSLQGGGPLQWFLGVSVLRNRTKRTIWLSQADYINKMSRFVASDRRRRRRTPMATTELLPYEGKASFAQITDYQRKTGTILYAAVITRPDVAFAISRLARFNQNPAPQHQEAANRVIEYLLDTANYALKLGGEDGMATWSDASFADNTIDRRSSQGYAMKLFGGTIGWRANKQDTVTTSTTEAELLALAQATKEALFANRMVKEIGITLDDEAIQLWCDNTQTIGLVTKEIATLQTKLRHVDIHNHWLREAVEKGQIRVNYTPTKQMVADGLTKALPEVDFLRFRDQIGVVDVTEALIARNGNLRLLTEEDLEALEDEFQGAEVEITSLLPTKEIGQPNASMAI